MCHAQDFFFLGYTMNLKAQILDEIAVDKALKRLSHEIIENCDDLSNVVFVGIKRRGVPLAKRLAQNIKTFSGADIPVGELDITLYRDDLSTISDKAILNDTKIDFPVQQKDVILVDDVIYTGRTIRAAIDGIFKLGRPSRIMLAVLVDRGHRELPIRGDFVGKNVPTSHHELIAVNIEELDGKTNVELWSKD